MRETFSGGGSILYLDWGVGYSGYTFVKTNQIIRSLCIPLYVNYTSIFFFNEKIRGD